MATDATLVSNLWTPAVWVPGVNEEMSNFPSLINSGAAVRNPRMDELASGEGTTANIPSFHDVTDTNDALQVEDTVPSGNNITGLTQVAVMRNRVVEFDVGALAAAITGTDPVAQCLAQIAMTRLKNRQKDMVNVLRGIIGGAAQSNGGAAGTLTSNLTTLSIENGTAATSANKISRSGIISALTVLGERFKQVLDGGFMLCHPNIHAALVSVNTSIQVFPADTKLVVEDYGGMDVFYSNLLVRAGGTSGYVYDTYFIAPGSVAWGERPQLGDVQDVASMQYYLNRYNNTASIFDRTRYILHPNGIAWTGTPGNVVAGPTNAELATPGNWSLKWASADRVGICCITTNG